MGGVDRAHDMGERRAIACDAEPAACLRQAGRFVAQSFQQSCHAVAPLRAADQQRHDATGAQLAGQIIKDLVARRLNVGDQFLHECVVVVGEALQHGIACLLLARHLACGHVHNGRGRVLAIDEGAFEREVDEAGCDAVLPDRNLPYDERRARGGLQHRQRFPHARRRDVDLVQKDEARNAELLELSQHELQRRDFALIRLADNDGGIAKRQHIWQVVREFDRSGAIDESKAVAEIVSRGDVRLDAHRMGACLGTRIADA